MNRFCEIDKTRDYGPYSYYDKFYVFVDSMNKDYNEYPPEVIEKASSSTSPFIGKTPQECHALLKELHTTTKSEFDLDYFAIMDERSMYDDTVLIVDATSEYGSVRADFGMAIQAMLVWMVGRSSVEEDNELAEKTQNVFSWNSLKVDSTGNNQS